jgi:hypothetical protein
MYFPGFLNLRQILFFHLFVMKNPDGEFGIYGLRLKYALHVQIFKVS